MIVGFISHPTHTNQVAQNFVKVEKWTLKFWKLYFLIFPDFLQNFAVNDFLKSFAECLIQFWFFSFLKIIFRHWIWNEIPDLEQNCCFKIFLCAFWKWIFGACRYFFLALVALECICCVFCFENVFWAGVALKIFFVAFLFEFFWRLSLRKWFFALVSVKIIFGSSRFKKCLPLTSLKMIFCFCPFESYFGR